MTAYYNENDKFAAEWLRNLIAEGLIAPGHVDDRSILDVTPNDLLGFTQCHFFAGIGCWSYALRRAGWSDDRPIWTASCPCQPFSAAGKGGGFDDERHLWPALYHLKRVCRPEITVGEQVTSKDGLIWLDLVQSDMEAQGDTFWAVDTCAAGVGAPHIRQRSYWMGLSPSGRRQRVGDQPAYGIPMQASQALGGLAHTSNVRCISGERLGPDAGEAAGMQGSAPPERVRHEPVSNDCGHGQLGIVSSSGSQGVANRRRDVFGSKGTAIERAGSEPTGSMGTGRDRASAPDSPWRDADWLLCRDGKWRAVEPGTQPLAHGIASRVGQLRAYGNAIVAQQAQAFIETIMGELP